MDQIPFVVQLRKALSQLTLQEIGASSRDSIWSSLYYAVSKEGETLKSMFPDADPSKFPKSWGEAMSTGRDTSFFKSKKENVTHVGRNCGRKFKKGEPIYRCLDCSFDHTCVLCVHCFNKEDHVGHQVNASICSGSNTGICDCGDPEAWKRELHCKCNSKVTNEYNEDDALFNDDYELFLQRIYDVCLDYIIEVFAHQNQTLPVINERLRQLVTRGNDRQEAVHLFQEEINRNILKPEKYGTETNTSQYCVVLWNDEFHNFQEAQTAIISATNDTRFGAKRVATDVDKEGRTILMEGSSIETLITGYANVQSNGLTATIMSKADFLRQDYTKTIIDWILDTTNFPNMAFQKIARRALCKSLCSTYNTDDLVDSAWNSLYTRYSGLLNGKNLPNVIHETIDFTKDAVTPSTKVSDISKGESALPLQSRVQYLLFFDLRYWKVLRTKVHDFLIPCLVSDLEYKVIACEQIVEIYGLLISNLSKLDREPHINALDEIACQYFTCPTNSSNITGGDTIRDVLYPIVHLFELHSRSLNSHPNKFRVPHKFLDKTTSIRKSFSRTINDLTYIFEKTTTLDNFLLPENFIPFCYLLRLFDSNWEIQRKVGEHVENESYEFVDYFSYILQLLGVVYAASDSSKIIPANKILVSQAIEQLLRLLLLQPAGQTRVYKSYELIDFRVSKEYTGFMNPSNVFLSRLLQIGAKSSEEVSELVSRFDFLQVVDSSLKAIVLCVQIESQFWVRNGLNPLKQAYTYKSPQLLHDTCYYRDVHLTQMAVISTDPERAFLNILNRFELLDWFSNKMQLSKTVYEDKVHVIVEKLISFLYILLSERSLFIEFESRDKELRHRLKQVLIYGLYYKPLTYSEIEESLSEELTAYEGLDDVLSEVASFTPPRGLNDDGRYSLKPEYFNLVDPLKLLAQVKDFQDNVTVITKTVAEQGEKSADEIIIEPKLAKLESFKTLGDFTRTKEFAKFVYKLLEYAIQTNEESFVPQLLHLLHAVFKDDEMIHGKAHVIESFNQIPVCESLFSIATSTDFSKQTTKKADYLLESLIVKDSRSFFEALSSCFGEDAVNSYKEKKKSSGINFDETEPERKRRIAKERQKKILEKMSKKQKLFIQKNDTESQADDSEMSVSPEDIRHCVLCQGPETPDELFGIPASFVKSNVFRNLPLQDKYYIHRAFKSWEDDLVGNNPDATGLGFPFQEGSTYNYSSSSIATSCNHGMHYKCLENYLREHNHATPAFACPLCKTFHNHFIPVFTPKEHTIDLEVLESVTLFDVFSEELMGEPTDGMRTEHHKSMKIVLGREYGAPGSKKKYMKKLLHILASSIRQSEISTRTNGSLSYTQFLEEIPEQTYRVLRGIFQSLLLLQNEFGYDEEDLGHIESLKHLDFVHHLVFDFFDGVSFYRQRIQKVLVRDTRQYLISLLNRVTKFGEFSVDLSGKVVTMEEVNAFRDLVRDMSVSLHVKERFLKDGKFASKIVKMLELLLLPELRSLCVFLKLAFPNFELQNVNDYNYDDIDLLLRAIGLPKFHQIVVDQANNVFKESSVISKLPYPGVIKLIDLPTELNFFTTTTNETSSDHSKRFKPEGNVQNSKNRIDFSVCLTCGRKVFKNEERNERLLHMRNKGCDSGPDALYLTPNTDIVNMMSSTIAGHYSKVVNAPYLNSHGQSGGKAVQNGQIARLNIERYKYLNNLWLTGSIFSYLSRNSSPVLPRIGLDNIGEERFWQQFLTNARTDIDPNLDDDQPFVFTFPPGANVDDLRGPVFDEGEESQMDSSEGEESDHMDHFEDDDDDNNGDNGFGFEEEEFEEGELDHFEELDQYEDLDEELMSEEEYGVYVDADIDEFEEQELFEGADDMEIEQFEDHEALDSDELA